MKPSGHWVNFHDRCLVGFGAGNASNFVLPAERLVVRGDFAQVAGPRALVAYAAGHTYFHGGASLQETVVPVITVRLGARQAKEPKQLEVTLSYRRGAKRITTLLPVIEVAVRSADHFSGGAELEFPPEAHDKKGQVVGEAKAGGPVNPATRTITLRRIDHRPVPQRRGGSRRRGPIQKPASWFELEANDLSLRKCLETKVDIFLDK